MTRHLASDLIESPCPQGDCDEAVDPAPSSGSTATLVAVHAHEVEHGDIIDGLALPVDSILIAIPVAVVVGFAASSVAAWVTTAVLERWHRQ